MKETNKPILNKEEMRSVFRSIRTFYLRPFDNFFAKRKHLPPTPWILQEYSGKGEEEFYRIFYPHTGQDHPELFRAYLGIIFSKYKNKPILKDPFDGIHDKYSKTK